MSLKTSPPSEILETCGKCFKTLVEPKTLPCLHSFCSPCLGEILNEHPKDLSKELQKDECKDSLLKPALKDSAPHNGTTGRCPRCATKFMLPKSGKISDLPTEMIVLNISTHKAATSQLESEEIKCGFCEEESASVHCASCDMFLGDSCQKGHSKSKATSSHSVVKMDEYFASASSPSKLQLVHYCFNHPPLEIDTFCKTCELPLCLSCILPAHNKHDCVKLKDISLDFSAEIERSLLLMQSQEEKVREAISLHSKTLEELKLNAQEAENQINIGFASLHESLDKKKALLLKETETLRLTKEKELMAEKEELEFYAEGMRSSSEFAKGLLENGTKVEIAMSKKAVLSRLESLSSSQMEKTPCADTVLRFYATGSEEIDDAIKKFGCVSGNQTSPKKSFVLWKDLLGKKDKEKEKEKEKEKDSPSVLKNKSVALDDQVSFQIISVNEENEKVVRGGDVYLVNVVGPLKSQVPVHDNGDGSYSVSFKATERGTHQVFVRFHGADILGSPFEMRVACVSTGLCHLEAEIPFLLVDTPAVLKMISVGENSVPMKHGGDSFTCSVKIGEQEQIQAKVTDENNGTYSFSFTPSSVGNCTISVQLEGKDIQGSPLSTSIIGADFFGGAKRVELLYDGKTHGYSSQVFHQRCDQINGTVSLVTLSNGAKFGGYNPGSWTSEGVYKKVPNAFLLSLTDGKGSEPQKFPLRNQLDHHAIYCRAMYGPVFGAGHDLVVHLDSLSSSSSTPSSYVLPTNATLAGTEGNWSFENVQVFRVL